MRRVAGAGLTFGGTSNTLNPGAQPQVFIAKLNNLGFDQSQMTNGIIGGWAIVNGTEFATYKDTLGIGVPSNTAAGFQGYQSTDIVAANAIATANVNDTGTGLLTASKTINSLRQAAAATVTTE